MGPSLNIDPLLAERPLSEEEYQLRVEFVKAYIQYRDAYTACIEIGFLAAYAADWARTFMNEGVVRRLIASADLEMGNTSASEIRKNRYRVMVENEATYRGPGASHAARVSALALLLKMEGMDKTVPETLPGQHKGGVMMVPSMTDPDSWGSLALQSQLRLKQSVRE